MLRAFAAGGSSRLPFWRVFALFGILWAGFFWPALHDGWWAMDDFWAVHWNSAVRWGSFVVGNGRPLLGLWSYTYLLDNGPGREWANILFRWLHGGIHVLSATLLACMFWNVVRSRAVVLAVTPFLLWPFNADAVLWRGGSIHAIAAFLPILGVYVIRLSGTPRDGFYWVAGSCLCAAGMLATQAPAFAGIIVWLVLVGLTAVREEPMPWRRLLREGAFLAGGSICGAAISYYLIKAYQLPPPWARSALATDLSAKLGFLLDLNRHVILFPKFYPLSLKILHVLLGALAVVAVFFGKAISTGRPGSLSRRLIAFLALLSCLVVPFSAQLIVAESAVLLRTLYMAPIFFTACFLMAFQLFRGRAWLQRTSTVLVFLILFSYRPISWGHAAEYVKCYKADLDDLQQVREHATSLGLTRVMVVPGTLFVLYNPRQFQYFFPCDHMNSLASPWVREFFLRRWGRLQPICQPEDTIILTDFEVDHDRAIMARALEQKKALRVSSRPQYEKIEGHEVMGIFMP